MHFFNLYIPNLRAQEYVSSEPTQRATWLNVSAFCCEQENGGRIVGAAKWTERQWMACGVTRREATHCEPLITFDGDDAIVWAYPENSEKTAQNKRLNGRRGGLAKAANASSNTPSVATSVATSVARDLPQAKDDSATSIPPTKEKESEEKRSEEKESELFPKPKRNKATLDEVIAFSKEIDLPQSDGASCFHKWEGNGWTNNGKKIVCWKSTMRAWKTAGYMPSQKNNGFAQPQKPAMPLKTRAQFIGEAGSRKMKLLPGETWPKNPDGSDQTPDQVGNAAYQEYLKAQ